MHRSSVGSRDGTGQGLDRIAAWSTALAGVIAIGSGFLFVAAADFHIDRILVPAEMLGSSSSQAELFRWAALTDMASYYLLLIPLFLAVRRALHSSGGGIVDLATVAGLMYALMAERPRSCSRSRCPRYWRPIRSRSRRRGAVRHWPSPW